MGADFIFAAVEWPKSEDGGLFPWGPDLVGILTSRVARAIKDTDDPEMLDFYDDDEDWREYALATANEIITACFTHSYPLWRDTSLFITPERTYVITGNMSWGDTTESHDGISLLTNLGVTVELISKEEVARYQSSVLN